MLYVNPFSTDRSRHEFCFAVRKLWSLKFWSHICFWVNIMHLYNYLIGYWKCSSTYLDIGNNLRKTTNRRSRGVLQELSFWAQFTSAFFWSVSDTLVCFGINKLIIYQSQSEVFPTPDHSQKNKKKQHIWCSNLYLSFRDTKRQFTLQK